MKDEICDTREVKSLRLDSYETELIGFAKEIIAYLVKSGIPPEQAEDVVQDVFVKLLEIPTTIPQEKLRAWMYRSSIRRYIDKYRRQVRYMELLQASFLGEQALAPFENACYEELKEIVVRLPKQDQLLLDLMYFQGFSQKEIAALLGWGLSKVKVSLFRSRKKLKKQLEEKGFGNGSIRIISKEEKS